MEDMQGLATAEISSAEVVLRSLLTVLSEPMQMVAANLVLTEFSLGQAKADAWSFYQTMKAREELIETEAVIQAARGGELEGRNAEERKRLEDAVRNMTPEVSHARGDTLVARRMSDCMNNAHASVANALNLAMVVVGGKG
jgi:hypothetical protein